MIADADDEQLGRQVTIKFVRPEWAESADFRRRFERTMQVMSTLSHPNLAAVHDWGQEEIGKRTTVFAVVERLDGGSLRDLFDRGRLLDPSQALVVGLDACRGLDFAHRHRLVHTELSPSKLVFGDDRRLRIVDFGLARLLGAHDWRNPSNLSTHTARYASPEQALAQPVDAPTDVYSLALILVEAVTGSVPFSARSTVATLSARVGRLMPVSADLGPLAAVLERAGRPEPSERSTAAELGRGLVRVAENLPRPAPIPILVSTVFEDDPNRLRRPNDPTGGVHRPDDPVAATVVDDPLAAEAAMDEALADGPDPDPDPGDDERPAPAGSDDDSDGGGAAGDDDGGGADADGGDGADAPDEPDEADQPGGSAGGPDLAPPLPLVAPPVVPPPLPQGHVDDEGHRAPVASGGTALAVAAVAAAAPVMVLARSGAAHGAAGESSAPMLYDGDPDATVDELAELAKGATPTDPPGPPNGTPAPAVEPAQTLEPARRGITATEPVDAPGAERGRRRAWPWLLALFVLGALAALGYVAYRLFRTPTHEVPALIGLTEADATRLTDGFDWEIDTELARSDEEPDAGEIIRTAPAAGEQLAEGEPFLIVISEGPELRMLPELSGRSLSDAETALAELRLVALPAVEAFDEEVPPGVVISWSVADDEALVAGDEVLPDTDIELVVSAGPEPRLVPDLTGTPVSDVTAQLEALRLVVTLAEPVFSDTVPLDGLVGIEPPAGTSVERGSTVVLTASKGVDLVTMPDLTGQTLPQIQATLAAAGLNIGGLLGSTQGVFVSASVTGESADPGDEYRRGTAIDMVLL